VLAIIWLVLVPLNLAGVLADGQVEWAWIAAPLIALVGAGAVIRLAATRHWLCSQPTEVAVLENSRRV